MNYDVIIVGGGPAGSAAAIRLAESGIRALVLEEKRMPRGKLCGEFIAPESFSSLDRLGVKGRLIEAGARKITCLSLIASNDKIVQAHISDMSGEGAWAMSLSRARFDQILFERAREAGAECLEGMAVGRCVYEEDSPAGVEAVSLPGGKTLSFKAPLIVDASGRNSRLMLKRGERIGGRRGSRLYAMKAHLAGVEGVEEGVELYFFPKGYGGLSPVEGGLTNLCFIADEKAIKAAGGNASEVVSRTIMKNARAGERLARAEVVGKWHSAGPLAFGARRLSQHGVIAVGDSSGMIDPFTGNGIQIALRAGELIAESIIECLGAMPTTVQSDAEGTNARMKANDPLSSGRSHLFRDVIDSYSARYSREFGKQMKAAGVLRKVALSSFSANFIASALTYMPGLAQSMLRATRGRYRRKGE